MKEMLILGQGIIKFYKKFEEPFIVILKFIYGFFAFGMISNLAQGQVPSSKVMLITLFCTVLTVISSSGTFLFLCGAVSCIYIGFLSIEAAAVVFLLIFLVFVFYIRIFPKESLIIPAMLTAYFFKVPYIIPLFAGLYVGVRALVPVAISVLIWTSLPTLNEIIALAPRAEFTPLGVIDTSVSIYNFLSNYFATNQQWIYISAVFLVSIMISFIINKLIIDNEKIIALIISSIIISFGLSIVVILIPSTELSIVETFIGTIISALIIFVIQNFEFVLDYDRAERVKFQDDNFYYYVKIVPKIPTSDFIDKK